MLIYDITNIGSFENLQDWLGIVKRTFAEKKEAMPYLAIIGNKVHLFCISGLFSFAWLCFRVEGSRWRSLLHSAATCLLD